MRSFFNISNKFLDHRKQEVSKSVLGNSGDYVEEKFRGESYSVILPVSSTSASPAIKWSPGPRQIASKTNDSKNLHTSHPLLFNS